MEANSGRRSGNGSLAHRNHRRCCERLWRLASILHLTYATRKYLNRLAQGNPSKVLNFRNTSDGLSTIGLFGKWPHRAVQEVGTQVMISFRKGNSVAPSKGCQCGPPTFFSRFYFLFLSPWGSR